MLCEGVPHSIVILIQTKGVCEELDPGMIPIVNRTYGRFASFGSILRVDTRVEHVFIKLNPVDALVQGFQV